MERTLFDATSLTSFYLLMAGMDPIARSATWLLIRRAARAGRAVVLTTHHLDEADVLADRVVIMSQGRVRCAGTLAHLREHFGSGYTLTLALPPGTTATDAIKAVRALVPAVEPPRTRERRQQQNDVDVEAPSGSEVTVKQLLRSQDVVIRVPAGSAGELPSLCDSLDSWSLPANGVYHQASASSPGAVSRTPRIVSYAINSLNLGDIFMAVVAEEEEEEDRRKELERESYVEAAPSCSFAACVAAARKFPQTVFVGSSDATQRQELLPSEACAAEMEATYAEALEVLCASRPASFAGALSYRDRLARHCSALARRRVASCRRDVKTLFIQIVVPALALIAGLALLLLVIPGNQPSYQPSTAAFNVPPWGQNTLQTAANVAPYLSYKADGIDVSVDMAGLPSLLRCIPDANWSIPESPALGVNASRVLPNEFSFFDGTMGPPTDDLGRFSTSILRDASTRSSSIYGAIAFSNNGSLIPIQATRNVELSADGPAEATYILLVNTTASHSPPLFMSLANSALYRAAANGGGCAVAPDTLPLTVRNHPLPLTTAQVQLMKGYNAGSAATLLMIVLCAAPAAIAHAAVRDRETGVRRTMDLAGLSSSAYWLSSWIFDSCTTLLTLSVCLGLFAAFDMAAFTSLISQRLQATISLMVLYCIAMPAQTYALSFAFSSASSAQMGVFLLNIACVGLMIISMIMGQAAPMAGCDCESCCADGVFQSRDIVTMRAYNNNILCLVCLQLMPAPAMLIDSSLVSVSAMACILFLFSASYPR